jgi:hypothetical protein
MRQGAHITRTMSLQATPAWWVERVLPMAAVALEFGVWGATEQRKQLRSNLLSLSCLD